MNLDVSWEQYHALIERLALKVFDSGWRFNQIICIARGGLRVGDVLSRIYEVPLAILSTHSYTAEGGTVRGQLVIAEHMTMTAPRLGERGGDEKLMRAAKSIEDALDRVIANPASRTPDLGGPLGTDAFGQRVAHAVE